MITYFFACLLQDLTSVKNLQKKHSLLIADIEAHKVIPALFKVKMSVAIIIMIIFCIYLYF